MGNAYLSSAAFWGASTNPLGASTPSDQEIGALALCVVAATFCLGLSWAARTLRRGAKRRRNKRANVSNEKSATPFAIFIATLAAETASFTRPPVATSARKRNTSVETRAAFAVASNEKRTANAGAERKRVAARSVASRFGRSSRRGLRARRR